MKNKKITMYELMGLIKDDKAPKKIKMYDEIYKLLDIKKDYMSNNKNTCLSTELQKLLKYNYLTTVLQTDIEILPEENDELEDIREIEILDFRKEPNDNLKDIAIIINQLIKNQKYLKEKLESKNEIK